MLWPVAQELLPPMKYLSFTWQFGLTPMTSDCARRRSGVAGESVSRGRSRKSITVGSLALPTTSNYRSPAVANLSSRVQVGIEAHLSPCLTRRPARDTLYSIAPRDPASGRRTWPCQPVDKAMLHTDYQLNSVLHRHRQLAGAVCQLMRRGVGTGIQRLDEWGEFDASGAK